MWAHCGRKMGARKCGGARRDRCSHAASEAQPETQQLPTENGSCMYISRRSMTPVLRIEDQGFDR